MLLNLIVNPAHAIGERNGKGGDGKGTITIAMACATGVVVIAPGCCVSGGASPLRAVMARTARLGRVSARGGIEQSRCPQLGFDEQKSDTRPASLGNPA